MSSKSNSKEYFDKLAISRIKWKKRNSYYHSKLQKAISYIISPGSRVLEVGCGTGELLNSMKPAYGVGIDFSLPMITIAKSQFTNLNFINQDVEELQLQETFDYVILSDLLATLWDVQKALKNVNTICNKQTRVVITNHNYLWEPILRLLENLGLKSKQPKQNWLLHDDIENLLKLEGFEIVKSENKLLFPIGIPFLSYFLNVLVGNLPFINKLSLVNIIVARKLFTESQNSSVTIVVPARNERGNIENAILRTPKFGKFQEFIFIEGHSKDNTWEEILRIQEKYKDHNIVALKQTQKGKGNAVREAFDVATGDILMILDADLTMPPEELPKFYNALNEKRGEFINGCRLVYPMEKEAMRFLNLLGNRFFGLLLSYLLGQKLKDTLCGTKVLFKSDYEKIKANRIYFGDFDPFGDFDLLFGAAKLNLKIVEIIIRYKDREYGSTQISRFSHGWLLVRMCLFASKKIKFI